MQFATRATDILTTFGHTIGTFQESSIDFGYGSPQTYKSIARCSECGKLFGLKMMGRSTIDILLLEIGKNRFIISIVDDLSNIGYQEVFFDYRSYLSDTFDRSVIWSQIKRWPNRQNFLCAKYQNLA